MMRHLCFALCIGVLASSLAGCASWHRSRPAGAPSAAKPGELTDAQKQRLSEADAAKAAGDYDTALTLFRDILAENPTITTAYLGIGDIYVVKKDYANAEPAYNRAARLEPRNFDAQYGHGLSLQMLSRFVDAIKAYGRALTIDPASFKANLNIAMTYLQMGDAGSGLEFAKKAVELDPSNGPAHVNLGAVYEKTGQNGPAIEQYLIAMELMEPTPELMMNLINVLSNERRYREAANTAESLVALAPSANAYERLGWAYFRLAEYDKSIEAYRSGVKLDANHWPSLNGVGVNAINTWLLSKHRDSAAAKEARTAFRRSLQANPDQPKIIALLSQYRL
jgi:tetratricopeptide (TPR) repeat protein